MRQHNISPRLAASPIRSLVSAAIDRVSVYPRREDLRQTSREVKARNGVDHPCAALDEIVCTALDRGHPDALAQCLGIAYALMDGIRRAAGVVGHIDYDAASLRETKAEGRSNVYQVQPLHRLSDDDLERAIVVAVEEIEADQERLLALECEAYNRKLARELGLKRLLPDARRSA